MDTQVEKIILEWESPARPYKTRSREFYTTILSIAFLLAIILILVKEFLLIGVIIAFAFLSYILATHKPDNVKHQLTSLGIRTDGKLWEWNTVTNFWIKKQWDQEVVICKTLANIPGVIVMVIDSKMKELIVKALSEKIPLITPEDTFVDKASKWLGEKIPLENS